MADSGNNVTCVDIDENKVKRLRNRQIPIYEPGLEALFDRSIREERLSFTTELEDTVRRTDIIFLCLPTPPGADGQADLQYVLQVARQIGACIPDYKIVVNKSTVPVGTAGKVRMTMEAETNVPFDVVSNPEFLREGSAVDDFLKPERVIVGTESEHAAKIMTRLYEPFVRSGNPIITMDVKSAELTKYAANAFLATKISFMNEVANLCERVGANVDEVRRGVGTDTRIGKRFLFAGIGYGGSCFPKDVQALAHTSRQSDYDFRILEAVMDVNERQKLSIVEKIKSFYADGVKSRTFALWGLSFKPETDDVRESPALYIVDALLEMGASIQAYDPEAMENFKEAIGPEKAARVNFMDNQSKALMNVDALIICTEWNEFRNPDFSLFTRSMKTPVIFDGRNLYDTASMEEAGIVYFSVGRRQVNVGKSSVDA